MCVYNKKYKMNKVRSKRAVEYRKIGRERVKN